MATYGTMNSIGRWADVPADKLPRLLDLVLTRESWFAPRQNRTPMTTHAEVEALLATGQDLPYGDDWYQVLRAKQMSQQAENAGITLVACDCGHSVQPISVMHASLGTSCPDCYDRLSA
mgnify:CR=1 FL=1